MESLQALAKKLEFSIKTENSSRYFGPRKDLEGFRPVKGSEIFVGRIPRNAYEDQIYRVFAKAGTIFKVKIMLNLDGTNKGYCFVEFIIPEFAQKAIEMFNGYQFRGKKLYVNLSTDHRNLIITGAQVSQDRLLQEIRSKVKDDGLVIEEVEPGTYLLLFSEHRYAQVTIKNFLPLQKQLWGASADLFWQPNEDVSRRLQAKKEFRQRPSSANSIDVRRSTPTGISSSDSGLDGNGSNKQNFPSRVCASYPSNSASNWANGASHLANGTPPLVFVEDMETLQCSATANMALLPPYLATNFTMPPPGFPFLPLPMPYLTPDLIPAVQQPQSDIYWNDGPSTSSACALDTGCGVSSQPVVQPSTSRGRAITKSVEIAYGTDLPEVISQPGNDVNTIVKKLTHVYRDMLTNPITRKEADTLYDFIHQLKINIRKATNAAPATVSPAATTTSAAGAVLAPVAMPAPATVSPAATTTSAAGAVLAPVAMPAPATVSPAATTTSAAGAVLAPVAMPAAAAVSAVQNIGVPHASYRDFEKISQETHEDDFNLHFLNPIGTEYALNRQLHEMYEYLNDPFSYPRRDGAVPKLEKE